ncbi:Valine--tRNA ligase [Bosea sp. 62]|uniref:valine--tRNA ligase n=1 Tax=unclassified Bosea (in: a-proteobacteria) TaxID=2653178 RepID=UPI00125B81AE|nr:MULTISPECIES: valine--tRNA ligase [unclassified Bosea (in: a-proteobacteria)]CAD5265653.1 Valine--tRNA ligase [Bosea sp. 46]CAD5267632.1 Valine--tRNA ligase [Bosea sp. 21B]CAD5271379.1 Valine--tRNA ligase [Bosea sp. 7B]VVT55647.1 Valine--tRNA ligase [Bosea sp. EC-HK365B]VXB87338.1 Valine--tRNA ligase [Bosea sp. 29B]
MMDKTFEPASVEARINKAWEEADAFKAGRGAAPGAEPYCIVIPPPNVTGSLHMGHALNNTLQDLLCRFERLRGKDVLWQPGTDHAGIATQMVVERKLAAENKTDRRTMGREAFLAEVWKWKDESGGTIVNQLKRLGASCDWSRERFTMDEGLSAAVLKVFVGLHKQGLIYRAKRLVNWDPKFQTAISDIEVLQLEKTGSFKWQRGGEEAFDAAKLEKALAKDPNGHLYYFDYPIEGVAYDAENPDTYITVATTRPETMLGDTGVAVHPENDKLKGLIGKSAVLPLVNRVIPIFGDDYADPEKGTGAVKITPAHDFNDFDVGKRNSLRVVNILDGEARILIQDNADFLEGAAPERETLALHGLDRFAARKVVVGLMAARGLLRKVEPNTHTVPHGDRSDVVIEPWLTDQWYVDVQPLAQRALAAVRDGKTRITPESWTKTYNDWLENIEPWCVSRQLWWGHQIPAWYGPDGECFVAESEAGAQALALGHYGGAVELKRDEDVLDTWFSSALWPFSTLGWPEETAELKRYYPTATLVTGFDIIFFWVARMMMMGLNFMDEVPFRDVYLHAMVRDEKGAKMSKSKGNVIDPLVLIDTYGADALRFTFAAMAAQGRDIKLATSRVEGYRNFATKIWNAARFAEINGCLRAEGFDPAGAKLPLNRWILSEAARTANAVAAGIAEFKFNEAADAAYRFVWGQFCDWYLELSKPVLQAEELDAAGTAARAETQATVAHVIDLICQLLHPFMPFLTEELWAQKANAGAPRTVPAGEAGLVCLTRWPELSALVDETAEAEIGFVVDLISDIRSIRSETNVPGGTQVPLVLVKASAATKAAVEAWAPMIERLARLSAIEFADEAPGQSAQIIVRGEVAALPLAGIIDLDAERGRLNKELAKLDQDIVAVERKLGNPDFMARAPEEIVEENRERKAAAEARKLKIAEALERLQ